jgi:hypothetical protein
VTALAFAGTAIGANDFIGILVAVGLTAYLVIILIRQGRV